MPARQPVPVPLRDISPELRSGICLGLITAAPVTIGPASPALQEEMDRLVRRRAESLAGCAPSEITGLAPARELYRGLGIDPTRYRPSSEALLRRILRGKPLPRILNAVDLCNLCSLEFLLPIGLYDAGRIDGQAVLRLGSEGEAYRGIRKDQVRLEGRPLLSDDSGPFGNPTSDSLRTSVTAATRSLFMIIFAPASYPVERMRANVEYATERMAMHLAGSGETVLTGTSLHEGAA